MLLLRRCSQMSFVRCCSFPVSFPDCPFQNVAADLYEIAGVHAFFAGSGIFQQVALRSGSKEHY